MRPQIAILPYRRAFRSPLRTAHGLWTERKGFIVRMEDSGRVGYGEVAPIPDFGTETVEEAGAFLTEWSRNPNVAIPRELPCCAFGLSAALAMDTRKRVPPVAALLPAGADALEVLSQKAAKGFTSFKWKIGVEPLATELALFTELIDQLPDGGSLRLDANGGIDVEELMKWIDAILPHLPKVEYLEQPLPVGQETRMAEVMRTSGVAIALDESLNGGAGDSLLREWKGPLVIKPALMGDMGALAHRLQSVAERVVLSSVFETGVGFANAMALAERLPDIQRAIGFDTCDVFDDDLDLAPETVWKQLAHLT